MSYNISSEAAAEYAASVTLPDADASLTAVTPGVTITPNDPAPLGGMTVMSISYSDLAGVMSFKNTVTNQFLTLSTSGAALTTSASIVLPRSRWYVQYDTELGYLISNYSDVYNTYLGFDDTDEFIIDSLDNMMDTFTVSIESTANSIVTIDCDQIAISSTGALYEKNEDDDYFPTSCEWQIVSKYDVTLITSIGTPTPRVEQKGVGFYLDYTVYPADATDYSIGLYYASTGQSVEHDTESYEDDEYEYFINTTGTYTVYYKDSVTGIQSQNFTLQIVEYVTGITVPSSVRIEQKNVGFELDYSFTPTTSTYYSISLYYADTNTEVPHTGDTYTISTPGVYTVYYKDSYSGVTSDDFTLIIVESLATYAPKDTYSITPASMPIGPDCLYLTMDNKSNSIDRLVLIEKDPDNDVKINRGDGANHYITCERLADVSRTFTFKYANASQNMEDGVYISATMSTSQYGTTPGSTNIDAGIKYTGSYSVLDSDTMPNTIVYADDSVDLIAKASGSLFKVCNMGSYYLIIYDITVSNDTSIVRALKINDANNDVEIAIYDGSDAFKWRIERVGVDAPAIKQVYKYWCGPTSFLQVLYGMDVATTVDGNNLSEQQTEISDAWGIGQAAVLTAHYKNNMNGLKYNFTYETVEPTDRWLPEEYTCNEIVNPTEQQLRTNIRSSLDSGAACIIFTVSGGNGHEYSPYKYSYKETNGTADAHYVCVIGYDEVSDTVILNNCHYSSYRFGIYEVDFSDFCEDVGRLLFFEKSSSQQGDS